MTVFKNYFKIVKRNKLVIFINLIVFIIIATFFASSSNPTKIDTDYKKISVGYTIKEDTIKNQGMTAYIKDTFKAKKISNDKKKIQDALFFQEVDYMIVLEKDEYQVYKAPNGAAATLVENNINNYLKTYDVYKATKGDLSEEELNKYTRDTMNEKVRVEQLETAGSSVAENVNTYFNMYVYSIFGTLVIGIGICTLAFKKNKVSERTAVSPMSIRKRNLNLFGAHIVFAVGVLLILNLLATIWFKEILWTGQFGMLILNSIVFLLPATAFAFMVSQIFGAMSAISSVSTVSGLAQSFLCGAFVPQEFMSDTILTIGKFLPGYWYVLNNNIISSSDKINMQDLIGPMLMQVLFALVFVGVGIFVAKGKMQKNKL